MPYQKNCATKKQFIYHGERVFFGGCVFGDTAEMSRPDVQGARAATQTNRQKRFSKSPNCPNLPVKTALIGVYFAPIRLRDPTQNHRGNRTEQKFSVWTVRQSF
jgi:hypothetical protein